MAAKRFHIETPEQLLKLTALAKPERKLLLIARVWKGAKRKKGATRWDNAIYAEFSGDRTRTAKIMRINAEGGQVDCADLRYNLALNWCQDNLKEYSECKDVSL